MNRQEWLDSGKPITDGYEISHQYLAQWKIKNNIPDNVICDVHHRNDTPECKAYNEAYYERWGLDETGEFIEGKYVQFLTRAQHQSYHANNRSDATIAKMRENHVGFSGKHHSAESCAKISENNARYWNGKKRGPYSVDYRAKMSEVMTGKNIGENNPFFGKHHSDEMIKNMRESCKKVANAAKYLYDVYRENGGKLKWNEFRHALKTGDITFETRPVSVFINGDE